MNSPQQAKLSNFDQNYDILSKTRVNLVKKDKMTGQGRKKDKSFKKGQKYFKRFRGLKKGQNLLKKDTWEPCANYKHVRINLAPIDYLSDYNSTADFRSEDPIFGEQIGCCSTD